MGGRGSGPIGGLLGPPGGGGGGGGPGGPPGPPGDGGGSICGGAIVQRKSILPATCLPGIDVSSSLTVSAGIPFKALSSARDTMDSYLLSCSVLRLAL